YLSSLSTRHPPWPTPFPYTTLFRSPGSALPGETGNAAFAAHRDTFFRALQGVRKGDEIAVTTPTGQFRYVVSSTRVVDPGDVSVDRKSARLNSSHEWISYAVFCLKK